MKKIVCVLMVVGASLSSMGEPLRRSIGVLPYLSADSGSPALLNNAGTQEGFDSYLEQLRQWRESGMLRAQQVASAQRELLVDVERNGDTYSVTNIRLSVDHLAYNLGFGDFQISICGVVGGALNEDLITVEKNSEIKIGPMAVLQYHNSQPVVAAVFDHNDTAYSVVTSATCRVRNP